MIVQETADAYGLLCLGVIFLLSQIFSRNYLLSSFRLFISNAKAGTSSKDSNPTPSNNVKGLSSVTTSLNQLRSLIGRPFSALTNFLRK